MKFHFSQGSVNKEDKPPYLSGKSDVGYTEDKM